MKEVIITDKVRQNDELHSLVKKNMEILEDAVGRSGPYVSAAWDMVEDQRGRSLVVLKLRDSRDNVETSNETKFAPAELENRLHMRFTLNHVWGDLLQMRSDKLREAFQRAE